jgi:T-lymphoma invasion and metastasis-inducing protein 1
MSLTTAVSEDEEGESADASPYKGARGGGGTTAASFNCTGAVRKAGYVYFIFLRPGVVISKIVASL